jgi:hypothetical protein
MTHPDIRAALGRERQNTLLADAEAARTARQARLYRRQAATPARRGSPPQCRAGIATQVVLRDEPAVVIRKAHSDAKLLAGAFAKLSAAMAGLLRSMHAHLLRRHPRIAEYQIRLSRSGDGPQEAIGGLEDEPRRWAPAKLGVSPAQAEVPQSSSADSLSMTWQDR